MRFYTKQHRHYCGIDLHSRTMYVCILDDAAKIVVHKDIRTRPDLLLKLIEPYREDIVIGVECMFAWYWLADLCSSEDITFTLGHALYMKAIHGGKSKNDRLDSEKIARILRGGTFPQAYVYPRHMRSTRDLLRRRLKLVRLRAHADVHIQMTNDQYNLEPLTKKLKSKCNRAGIAERFEDTSVNASVQLDLDLMQFYDKKIQEVELYLERTAKLDRPYEYQLLRTVPGIGRILAMTMLYEIHDIGRFQRVQDFVSYSRLIRCTKTSAGKRVPGASTSKMGNAHLKWAFSEAAVCFLRQGLERKKLYDRLVNKHGKGKSLGVLRAKIGRAIYFMLKNQVPFDERRFLAA